MKKTNRYDGILFPSNVIREASETFRRKVDPDGQIEPKFYLSVQVGNTEWHHDTEEEFFADYHNVSDGRAELLGGAVYHESIGNRHELWLHLHKDGLTQISVRSTGRPNIESVFEIFEQNIEQSRIPVSPRPPMKPKIFVGHGQNTLWRELKDHLQDQHNHDVIAYEVGARAGHGIRDILEDMLNESSFAILVMTGEDVTIENELHPRLNVVHELGLFQGRLGFSRAIALLEEGTKEFSNIHGVQQIRFSKGNIKEAFGHVLATLSREFGQAMQC